MHWNPEITLGTVIETVSIVVVVIGAGIKFGKIEQKVNIMYAWFEEVVIGANGVKKAHEDKKFFGVE